MLVRTTLLAAAISLVACSSQPSLGEGLEGSRDPATDPHGEAQKNDGTGPSKPDVETTAPLQETCSAAEAIADPALAMPHAVGSTTYQAGTMTAGSFTVRVSAAVWYPASAPGVDTPILTGAKLPLVLALHGNHDNIRTGSATTCATNFNQAVAQPGARELPSHLGYEYIARNLAASGVVVVSVNANDINCQLNGTFVPERVALLRKHLALFTGGAAPANVQTLRAQVDLQEVGFMGHSRGGEAVVRAAIGGAPSATIRGVLSLAPTAFDAVDALPRLAGVPLLVVLPSADGDLGTNPGARIYDSTTKKTGDAGWFKAQHHLIGANHNFFNTQWNDTGLVNGVLKAGGDDGIDNGANRLTAVEQRAYAVTTARAFFDTVFGRADLRGVVSGMVPVTGHENVHVWGSFTDTDAYVQSPTGPLTTGFQSFGEFQLSQFRTPMFNATFFHEEAGYVGRWSSGAPEIVEKASLDLSRQTSVRFRAAQVVDPNGAGEPVVLDVEVEDANGQRAVVGSDAIGVKLPIPYARPAWADGTGGTRKVTKSMLGTVRVPSKCFKEKNPALDLQSIIAVRVRPRSTKGVIAIADFQ